MNRVVVTGLGVVSPVGCTIDEFWSALVQARSGIRPIQRIATARLSTALAAQVLDYDPQAQFGSKRASLMDRFSQFAVSAACAAVSDARLQIDEQLAPEVATIIGTGAGGVTTIDDAYLKLYGENSSKVHPLTVPRLMVSAAASHISIALGLKGPAYSVASACASGTHAIGQAFHMIRSGSVPVAIAGGSEACLTVGTIKSWEALRVLSNETCRPFSKSRSGIVLGEGAAILVLEARDRALARGASIYAEVRGFGMSADASDILSPAVEGAAQAMRAALRDANADVQEIDYVNAHGTGTTVNDRTETSALRLVFGSHAERLAISSNKAVLGHGLGAAGALEAAATALTLRHQVAPPTANFEQRDPECGLDVIPNVARPMPVGAAMSNSFAFGGLNAVLVLGRVA
jgi:nodulation protein E